MNKKKLNWILAQGNAELNYNSSINQYLVHQVKRENIIVFKRKEIIYINLVIWFVFAIRYTAVASCYSLMIPVERSVIFGIKKPYIHCCFDRNDARNTIKIIKKNKKNSLAVSIDFFFFVCLEWNVIVIFPAFENLLFNNRHLNCFKLSETALKFSTTKSTNQWPAAVRCWWFTWFGEEFVFCEKIVCFYGWLLTRMMIFRSLNWFICL